MDPGPTPGLLMAAGASTAAAWRAPGRDEALPPVDAIILKEDSGREILDGYVVEAMSSEEPHATLHSRIDRVLGPCVQDDYEVAVDMLTRTDHRNEFAPETGGRKIEELAFEVIDTTRFAEVTDKARKLVGRGVRRVFVVDVNAHTVIEWSRPKDAWQSLAARASIKDRCLAAPVPIKALLDAAEAEWAIVRGLKARQAPALVYELARSRDEGRTEGMAVAVLRLCSQPGLVLTAEQVARVHGCKDPALLERWLDHAVTATRGDAVFAE